MIQKFILAGAYYLIFLTLYAHAANFPGTLTGDDIENANTKLAGAMQHRSWTHASSRPPNESIDLSFGIESSLTLGTNVNKYGDGTGRVPSAMPIPKLYGSVHFEPDVHVSASVFPGGSIAGITTFGLSGEWFFVRDRKMVDYSVLAHYSHSRLFGDYSANTQGLQLCASHDFRDFVLYGAGGFISVESKVRSQLLAPGTKEQYYGSYHTHFILGTRIAGDFPISFQAELIAREVNLGLLIAKEF